MPLQRHGRTPVLRDQGLTRKRTPASLIDGLLQLPVVAARLPALPPTQTPHPSTTPLVLATVTRSTHNSPQIQSPLSNEPLQHKEWSCSTSTISTEAEARQAAPKRHDVVQYTAPHLPSSTAARGTDEGGQTGHMRPCRTTQQAGPCLTPCSCSTTGKTCQQRMNATKNPMETKRSVVRVRD
jgi:hypothetical protein